MRNIPWQSRRSSTCSSLLAVECTAMVFNALQMNCYVFSEEIDANAIKIRLVDEGSTHCHWQLRSANSASITSLAIQRRRLGAGKQHLASAVPQLQHAYWQTKAFQPCDCHQILTSSRTLNDDLRFCLSACAKSVNGEGRRERAPVNFLKESFADEETCGDRYLIDHAGRWLDQRVAILADQPLCRDELDEQLSSLLCQY